MKKTRDVPPHELASRARHRARCALVCRLMTCSPTRRSGGSTMRSCVTELPCHRFLGRSAGVLGVDTTKLVSRHVVSVIGSRARLYRGRVVDSGVFGAGSGDASTCADCRDLQRVIWRWHRDGADAWAMAHLRVGCRRLLRCLVGGQEESDKRMSRWFGGWTSVSLHDLSRTPLKRPST